MGIYFDYLGPKENKTKHETEGNILVQKWLT